MRELSPKSFDSLAMYSLGHICFGLKEIFVHVQRLLLRHVFPGVVLSWKHPLGILLSYFGHGSYTSFDFDLVCLRPLKYAAIPQRLSFGRRGCCQV